MVFKTGANIEEMKKEDCGLATNARTILCSTMQVGFVLARIFNFSVTWVNPWGKPWGLTNDGMVMKHGICCATDGWY